MPRFQRIPMIEAKMKTATGRRGQIAKQYMDYIQQVDNGWAGVLQPAEDEKILTVRRHLNNAATTLGMQLVIKRVGNEIYFWTEASEEQKPRRSRRRKTAEADSQPQPMEQYSPEV